MPVHPYIPNSVHEIKKRMLSEIGLGSIEDLFSCIPNSIRLKRSLNIASSRSEYEVSNEIQQIMSKNHTAEEALSFLGAGCWSHFIPAVCNEINSRSEFVTAYTGDVYSDLGRYQVLFEFQSMIGELVGLDAIGFPLYDWSIASADAARMALISTNRKEILLPSSSNPARKEVVRLHCDTIGTVREVDFDLNTGQIDIEDLKSKISKDTAGVYIENPSYLGHIESQAKDIGEIVHDAGAEFIVGVDPLSLGVLKAPGDYGADIVTGEGQPLGMPLAYGGALMGFIATRDEKKYVDASGNRMITITSTQRENEHGFAYILSDRTIFCSRDKSPTYTGTATVLWAITAAVYMALLGPQGFRDLGTTIMQNSHYAMKCLSEISDVVSPLLNAAHFKEFLVRFPENESVASVNRKLRKRGIFGGKDISKEFPELGNSALYCVTEKHSQEDIDRLTRTLQEVIV